MRVLVTGASGFIGSRLVHRLTEEGHDVFCVGRDGAGRSTSGTDVFWDLESSVTPLGLPDHIDAVARPYADLFDVSILRLFFPYGPGQTERLVPDVIERVRNGTPVQLASDGEGLRLVPTFVDDIAAVMETALAAHWRGVFNIASPAVVNLRELAEVIGSALGKQPCFDVNDRKAGAIVPDLERLRRRFDFSRFTTLEEGIRRTLAAQTESES